LNGTTRDERSVKELYHDETVAREYIDERLRHSWWRHLHEVQVAEINRVIARHSPADVLEIAPGPARLAPDLHGVKKGLMVEASPHMIDAARHRLREAHLANVWDIVEGNAFDLAPLDRRFDFVFTFRLIRHFDAPERRRIYEQVAERLRPGGHFLFDVVNSITRARIDAREGARHGLDVFDATYRGSVEVCAELEPCGFDLVRLRGVLNHFERQSRLSYRLDRRFFRAALAMIRATDRIPAVHPLEWVAVLRKK